MNKIHMLFLSLVLFSGCAKGKVNTHSVASPSDSSKTDNLITTSSPLMEQEKVLADARYTRTDSLCIEKLLSAARTQPDSTNWMLYFGRQFIDIPYVGKTLDREMEEHLVVNTRELDCTTFVETVLALDQCMRHHTCTFKDFLCELRRIRYIDGEMSYINRQHYFTVWMDNNQKMDIVKDIQGPNPPFTAIQHLQVNWMTTHIKDYPQLVAHPEWVDGIRKMEQSVTGSKRRYIPKGQIANNRLFRQTIHDGDILVILTAKPGLDTSHIGIAAWHKDGLHLLNASYLRHKVVEEPKTLYLYMQGQRSQTGIRVCRARK